MSKVELRQIVGETRIRGVVHRIKHDMDILLLDDRQIATINHVPGAAIRLLDSTALSPSQEETVMQAVAAERGGVRPSRIVATLRLPGELVDDEETTDVDDE
jgi:hypothetical protein